MCTLPNSKKQILKIGEILFLLGVHQRKERAGIHSQTAVEVNVFKFASASRVEIDLKKAVSQLGNFLSLAMIVPNGKIFVAETGKAIFFSDFSPKFFVTRASK